MLIEKRTIFEWMHSPYLQKRVHQWGWFQNHFRVCWREVDTILSHVEQPSSTNDQTREHIRSDISHVLSCYLQAIVIKCGASAWTHSGLVVRARINSWIELELIINSIELKDFELELNWNWKPELIGIDQFNQFIFNSTPHFTRLNIFLYAILWKL